MTIVSTGIEGFTTEHWLRLGDVFGEAGRHSEASPRRIGGVVAVTRGSASGPGGMRLVRLVHTLRGEIATADVAWPTSLGDLARACGATWAIELEASVLVRLEREFRPSPDADYLSQVIDLWRLLRAMQSGSSVRTWPHRIEEWPAVVGLASTRLEDLCPTDGTAVLGLWNDGQLSTAFAARRRHGNIERLLGPTVLRSAMGIVSGSWDRDYRYLTQAVERLLGPVDLGFFGEERTVRRLVRSGHSRDWARALAARDLIVSPWSASAALPAGFQMGRRFISRARSFARSHGFSGYVPAEIDALLEPSAVRPDYRDLLGFDPVGLIELLATSLDEGQVAAQDVGAVTSHAEGG